ncbi:MAG: Rieske (2Fe-2S) protein [Desulfobulbaceae bacterium]|nr:Rieske (2Fe-2S) protein [Desulfobulbaceae bacterium]
MNRRTLLKWAVRGIGATVAAMAGIPALIAGFSPVWQRRPHKENWQSLGPVDEFPVGEMREIVVELPPEEWGEALREKTVYAWRPSDREAVVYSRSCTDLGCPLTFDPGSQCFFCPCHGGIFDRNGERLAGPPKRPMYRYAVRIVNREIVIDLHSVPLVA